MSMATPCPMRADMSRVLTATFTMAESCVGMKSIPVMSQIAATQMAARSPLYGETSDRSRRAEVRLL